MTIAQTWEDRTFVRENTPRWHCSYPITATAGHAAQPFDNGVINNKDIDKSVIE